MNSSLRKQEMAAYSDSAYNCVTNLQCLQAFTELVLRTAHFRVFGTGKKHLVDICNMVLRTGGHEVANKLLSMLSSPSDKDRKEVAYKTIIDVMSSCILCKKEDNVEEAIPLPPVPQMYLQTIDVGENWDDGGLFSFLNPVLHRQPEKQLCECWDLCWEKLACRTAEGMRMVLFRPLLLHITGIAGKMIDANAAYLEPFLELR